MKTWKMYKDTRRMPFSPGSQRGDFVTGRGEVKGREKIFYGTFEYRRRGKGV